MIWGVAAVFCFSFAGTALAFAWGYRRGVAHGFEDGERLGRLRRGR